VDLRALPHGGAGNVTLANPAGYSRVTAVVVNSDIGQTGFDSGAGDWKWTGDGKPFEAAVSTDFTAPRVVRTSPHGLSRVTVVFSERMTGVDSSSLRLIAPGGHAVPARVLFRNGSRTATIVPRRPLRPASTYQIRFGPQITDLALNPLRPPARRSFKTAR
jgi:hypothetical protein